MNRLRLFLSAFFITANVLAQPVALTEEFSVFPVKTIQSLQDNYSDLNFLKNVLKDKRVVLLGEQSHGEGATFEAKVRLIKFLHQEMGYEVLAFESDLLDGYHAWQQVKSKSAKESPLKESIYTIWSETKELEPLLEYVHEKAGTARPLIVAGFDCQGSILLRDGLLNEIIKATDKTIALSEEEATSIQQVLEAGAEFLAEKESDSITFFNAAGKIISGLKKSIAADSTLLKSMLRQSFTGWVEMVKWQMDELHEREVKVQNPRDLQMARNLIYLSKLYPGKKIIAWGATYHFANQLELVEYTDITKAFAKKMDSVQHNHEPADVQKLMEGAKPMGGILKQHFGNALYSVAFSSFEGRFGMVGFPSMSLETLRPPDGSIEQVLVKAGQHQAFVDFSAGTRNRKFYSSALGNLPLYAPWQKIVDGLFFIKISYPPSLAGSVTTPVTSQSSLVKEKSYITSHFSRVVDGQTGEGIGYANISLMNTSKGVSTNAGGEFVFNIPGAKPTDRIVLSSIGYQTDTLTVHELTGKATITLTPKTYQLAEMEFRSKPLTAREIIKLAEKQIEKNYVQQAHQQEFFYRVSDYKEDSLIFNEEAAVLVHDPDGYKPTTKVTKNLKGEILQFRNTTQNVDKDLWAGTGSLWLIYVHDAVLDKDNVLHRSGYYDLTLAGITAFENKHVYEIEFVCRRPGAFTTGFGYPAPRQASGKIYIEVGSYAVLKIETTIVRKPYRSKRRPELTQDPYGHHLVQTYKEFDGKYFLNYSRQAHFGRWTNAKENWAYRTVSIRELLSTEIIINPVQVPALSLTNIKSRPVKEDSEFWKSHNIVVQDEVKELLKLADAEKK